MKKIFYLSMILLAAACSKSGSEMEEQPEIRFNLGFSGQQTKATANAFEST